jgi:GT2 family glycosyltransferase
VALLVVANACSDGTLDLLRARAARPTEEGALPLRFLAEPRRGKSHALNLALAHLQAPLVAMVDDDHRVDAGYLEAVVAAAAAHPEAELFCGRILPDWDGREPAWVHDTGPWRIYPLPVPRFDQGDAPQVLPRGGPVPGGGNLAFRRALVERVGTFADHLGPFGNNLAGGEDIDWVYRAQGAGAVVRYVPTMIQYHYVDLARLRLSYLVRKAYQRSRATTRVEGRPGVPAYLWRKAAGYLVHVLLAKDRTRRRHYLVRLGAALGEMSGHRAAAQDSHNKGLK